MNQSFKSIFSIASQHLTRGLDWLFPRVCYGCRTSHQPEKISNICIFCWGKMAQPQHLQVSHANLEIFSAGIYEEPLKRTIIQAKFKNNIMCRDVAFELIYSTYQKIPLRFDLITSVPASYWRSFTRGIDLPGSLAKQLSRQTQIEFRTNVLKKGQKQKRQGRLNSLERAENMKNAFEAAPDVRGKTILVIDDIMTTGNTIKACYRALKRHKPAHIVFLTIAKTSF